LSPLPPPLSPPPTPYRTTPKQAALPDRFTCLHPSAVLLQNGRRFLRVATREGPARTLAAPHRRRIIIIIIIIITNVLTAETSAAAAVAATTAVRRPGAYPVS